MRAGDRVGNEEDTEDVAIFVCFPAGDLQHCRGM